MSDTVSCPGCRRRVRVPDGTDLGRSRCSKCRTRLQPDGGDAYHLYASTALELPAAAPPPAVEPLSLDECEPIPTVGAPTVEHAPPFKVPAAVVTAHPLRGPVTAVLTPFGLFAERDPDRPLLFAPVGTRAAAVGRALRLELPGKPLVLVLPGAKLAADAAAFLSGKRPVPDPADYATPGWVLPPTALVVLVLAALAFVGGTVLYVALRPAGGIDVPAPAPAPPPVPPPVEPPPPPPAEPDAPPTHLDLAARDGMTRLADGPAAVTALGVTPDGGETVVGYADGATWAWRLDQPAFEPPRVGPHGVGPVRRIEFGAKADVVYLTGDTGLAVANYRAPRPPVFIAGHPVAAAPEPPRERFAALRADKIVVRYVPMALATDPPASRVKGGQVTSTPKDETQFRPDQPAPGATFLAWHPAGKLVYGSPDGTVAALPAGGKAAPPSKAHKAPVRAWAVGPTWPDFATGDAAGVVGVWPDKAQAPYLLKVGAAAVTQLSFGPCGGELAVADAAGAVAVWNLPTKARAFQVTRPPPVAVAYGPRADVLLISDGKGVEVWSLPALAARAGGSWP